jgi:hypothetical protein
MADLPPNKTRIALAAIAAVVVLLGGYEALAQWLGVVPSLLSLFAL